MMSRPIWQRRTQISTNRNVSVVLWPPTEGEHGPMPPSIVIAEGKNEGTRDNPKWTNKDIRLTLDKVPRIMADLQIAYTQAVMIENGPTPTSASLPPPQPSSEPNLAGKIFQAVHVETKLNAGAAALANRFGASQEEVTAAVKTLQTQKMVKIEVDGLTPYLVPV